MKIRFNRAPLVIADKRLAYEPDNSLVKATPALWQADLDTAVRYGQAMRERAELAEAQLARLRAMLALTPAEKIALTVAMARLGQGNQPGPNVAATCILALSKIRESAILSTGDRLSPFERAPALASAGHPTDGEVDGFCTCDGPTHDPMLAMSCGRKGHRADAKALLHRPASPVVASTANDEETR